MFEKYVKKIFIVLLIMLSLIILIPKQANAVWKQNSNGWWYEELNSWAIGWKYINGQWYYFYPSGYMASDTIIDGHYVNSNGQWIEKFSAPNSTNNLSFNYNNKDLKLSQNLNDKRKKTSFNHNNLKTTELQNYISEEKVKQIVLSHARVSADSVKNIDIELDYEKGFAIYEVDFNVGYMEYEYDLNAITGEIIRYNREYDD